MAWLSLQLCCVLCSPTFSSSSWLLLPFGFTWVDTIRTKGVLRSSSVGRSMRKKQKKTVFLQDPQEEASTIYRFTRSPILERRHDDHVVSSHFPFSVFLSRCPRSVHLTLDWMAALWARGFTKFIIIIIIAIRSVSSSS